MKNFLSETALSSVQRETSIRTTLGAVHIYHGLLYRMHSITLDTTNTLDRGNMTAIGRQSRHETSIHRIVSGAKTSEHKVE